MKSDSGPSIVAPPGVDRRGACTPGQHDQYHNAGDEQRQPAPVDDFRQVGQEEHKLHAKDERDGDDDLPRGYPPHESRQHQENGHLQQQGAGDCQAVGAGQCLGALEDADEQHDAYEEDPVDGADVDLSALFLGGVRHVEARQQPCADGLAGYGEGARDDRLRGDHRGHGGQDHERDARPVRRQVEERIGHDGRVTQDRRTLAHVVDRQGRENQEEPGQPNRLGPEVAHVGIERLNTGHCEDDRTCSDEGDPRVAQAELNGVVWGDGAQNLGIRHNVRQAQRRPT